MKNLIVISNDKLFFSKRGISSKFNDTLNILDALQKKFNIFLISRNAYTPENFNLKLNQVLIFLIEYIGLYFCTKSFISKLLFFLIDPKE